MTVIAFRPRPAPADTGHEDGQTDFTGTFRSPRGRLATMTGQLRLQRLVLTPRGAFVTGVFTGELHEPDGSLIGVDTRRCTVPAVLRRSDEGLRAMVRPMRLDLMGITVQVPEFDVGTEVVLPPSASHPRRAHRPAPRLRVVPSP